MGLADGRSRDGLIVERGEERLDRAAQLGRDDRAYRGARFRRDLVLKSRQLALVRGRQKIWARGGDLAELHEGRPELLERHAHVLGTRIRRGAPRMAEQTAVERHERIDAERADDVAEPVADENGRDRPQARRPFHHGGLGAGHLTPAPSPKAAPRSVVTHARGLVAASTVVGVGAVPEVVGGIAVEARLAARAAEVVGDAFVDGRRRRLAIDGLGTDRTVQHVVLLARQCDALVIPTQRLTTLPDERL